MNSSLYRKFFFRFLLVMLVPVFLLCSTIVAINLFRISDSVRMHSSQIFTIVNQSLSQKTRQMSNGPYFLGTTSTELQQTTFTNGYEKYLMVNNLKRISNTLGYCTDVGIIHFEKNKILSANGESSIDIYFSDTEMEPKLLLSSAGSILYLYKSEISPYFIFLTPMTPDGQISLFFIFSVQELYNEVLPLLTDMETQISLQQGHSLVPLNGNMSEESTFQTISQFISENNSQRGAFPAVFGQFFLCALPLERFDMTVYAAVPIRSAVAPLLTYISLSFLAIALTIVIDLCLTRHLTKSNYQPIQQIMSSLNVNSTKETKNEIFSIQSALEQLKGQVTYLSQVLNRNQESLKKILLMRLLYGQIKNAPQFLEEAADVGIESLYPYFAVSVFSFDKAEDLDTAYKYIRFLTLEGMQFLALDSTEQNQFILIINYENEHTDPGVVMKSIKEYLFSSLHLECTVGLSADTGGFDALPKLYISASNALNYCFIVGKHTITTSPPYLSDPNPDPNPVPSLSDFDINTFESCIIEADETALSNLLYEKFKEIRNSGLPLNYIKIYLFDMIYCVRDIFHRLGLHDTKTFEKDLAEVMLTADSIEDLFNRLYYITTDVSKLVRTISSDQKLESICQYIEAHYCDPMFSVTALSDYIQISPSALSRFFKKHMGTTVSDYIFDLKISKAKELLSETDKSIDQIVEEIGYQNVSSFIRRFKMNVGVTPGKYRLQAYSQK